MNKRQRMFLLRFVVVIVITVAMVVAVSNFKEYVNRSETLRAMADLGNHVSEYRKSRGGLPPEEYIEDIRDELTGVARVGNIHYRGEYINYLSSPDTILAYSKKDFSGFVLPDGYVVLRLNNKVEWLTEEQFNTEMALEWGENEERP